MRLAKARTFPKNAQRKQPRRWRVSRWEFRVTNFVFVNSQRFDIRTMAKHVLKTDSKEVYDFLLFGIICQHHDYRLCFEINRAINLSLERATDLELTLNKGKDKIKTSRFEYKDGFGNEYFVLSNK